MNDLTNVLEVVAANVVPSVEVVEVVLTVEEIAAAAELAKIAAIILAIGESKKTPLTDLQLIDVKNICFAASMKDFNGVTLSENEVTIMKFRTTVLSIAVGKGKLEAAAKSLLVELQKKYETDLQAYEINAFKVYSDFLKREKNATDSLKSIKTNVNKLSIDSLKTLVSELIDSFGVAPVAPVLGKVKKVSTAAKKDKKEKSEKSVNSEVARIFAETPEATTEEIIESLYVTFADREQKNVAYMAKKSIKAFKSAELAKVAPAA